MLYTDIIKIGAIISDFGSVLLVRKKGAPSYILPGGKPEAGETDLEALEREIGEELGCTVDPSSVVFLGEFRDQAADLPNTFVRVRLYAANVIGTPMPAAEIDRLDWVSPDPSNVDLAPSLRNSIFPYLLQKGYFSTNGYEAR